MGRLIEFDRGPLWLTLLVVALSTAMFAADTPTVYAQEAEETSEEAAVEEAETTEVPAGEESAESTEAEPTGSNTTLEATSHALDTVWVMVAAFLVMWMQAGFALVETGLTRAKNAVNICMKNLLDFSFGSILFWVVGFSIMFGGANKFWGGLDGMFLSTESESFESLSWSLVPLDAKFFFQMVFAATTATIVSGAMAERTKFTSYMIYSIVVTALIYPISGHWIWGGGWLGADYNFWDFAGSTVVHSCGAWLALAGAFVLGPRIGKYDSAGNPKSMF